MPRLSLVLILKKVEKWETAYLRLRAVREQMRDPVVGTDDHFLAAFHGESAAREMSCAEPFRADAAWRIANTRPK
jgi:hypothetical protein